MLTVKGKSNKFLAVDSESSEVGVVECFDWKNALVDSSILAVLGFFTALSVSNLFGGEVLQNVVEASIGACIQFFTILAIKRGIKDSSS